MKLLILGETVFLGRALVDAALARGHEVTLFNRGISSPEAYPGLRQVHGDRDGGLSALGDERFDAVIDTCGYVPRIVRQSAAYFAARAGHYTFISTISVFANFRQRGMDESAPTGHLDDESLEEVTGDSYGPLKALCEAAAEEEMPGRTLSVRPGLIVGPFDPSDRFTYWPVRVAEGGEVLAPESPGYGVQIIDVRDLAAWNIEMVERGVTGVFNATGPERELTLGEVLERAKEVSKSDATFTWASKEFLLVQKVTPWVEMPLWVADDGGAMAGFSAINCSKAIGQGLRFRQLDETIVATLAWARERPKGTPKAGLARDRERAILAAWQRGAAGVAGGGGVASG